MSCPVSLISCLTHPTSNQISEIHTYGNDFVVFESVMYDETMNFTVPKHNVLTCDEIMQLIRGKSEIDLSAMTAPEK